MITPPKKKKYIYINLLLITIITIMIMAINNHYGKPLITIIKWPLYIYTHGFSAGESAAFCGIATCRR